MDNDEKGRIAELGAEVGRLRAELAESNEALESQDRQFRQGYYRGNSIGYIYDKMRCYQDQVIPAYDALRLLGCDMTNANGNVDRARIIAEWAHREKEHTERAESSFNALAKAVREIASAKLEGHTCKDHVLQGIAKKALSSLHGKTEGKPDPRDARIAELEVAAKKYCAQLDHLRHAVYEACTYSVIPAPTEEKLRAARFWEPEASRPAKPEAKP